MTDTSTTALEDIMMGIPGGLGRTIGGRMMLFGAAGGAFAHFVRPEMSFDANGNPRPWILLDGNNPEATLFPAAAYVVVPALLFGMFV